MISAYDIGGSYTANQRWLYGRNCALTNSVLCETQAPSSGGQTGNCMQLRFLSVKEMMWISLRIEARMALLLATSKR